LSDHDSPTELSPDPFWNRVRALFHAASDQPEGERERFVQEASDGDEALCREVLALLQADADDGFLEPAPPARRSFTAGDLVASRYSIIRLLGTGGMGEVYEADDRELQEPVALKIIRSDIAANPRVLARFKREIQLARRVTHPNVCRIYDVSHHVSSEDADDRRISFVSMELLHGRTLAAHLRETAPLSPAIALPIVRQLCAGLDAAHDAGIVHRDFKSANIMLVSSTGPAPRAVVTDFGLAQETRSAGNVDPARLTDSGMLVGTPDYMAPEQLQDGDITPATDVYALGVVLFEMVTGRLPFDGATPLSLALTRLQEPAPSPRRWAPDLDPRWEAVILRCLERDPAQRFARAGEVAAALEPDAPLLPERTKGDHASQLFLRSPLLWGAVAVALLAILVPLALRSKTPKTSPAPAATVTPRAEIEPRRAVAVLGFRNLSGRADSGWLSAAFAELLHTELAAADTLRVAQGDDVQRLESDLGLTQGDALSRTALDEVRQRIGADVVVSGSYVVLTGPARPLRLDLRVQDASSGKVLHTLSESGTEYELFPLVSRMGTRLRSVLGAIALTPAATAGLRASLPSNAEAAKAYVEGLTRLRRYDALGARGSFERAVELEPEFPMSRAALAEALWTLGFEAQAIEAADRALLLAKDLAREERLSIEARTHVFHKEFDKAIELYRSLLTFYPDEVPYGIRLATTQIAAAKANDALATVEKLQALPKPLGADPMLDVLAADAYHLLHDYEKELTVARRAEAEGAALKMRRVVALAKSNQSYAHRDLGHPEDAVRLLEEAAAIFGEIGDRSGEARCLTNLGLALWNRGDLAAAEPVLARALVILRQVGSRSFESRTLNNIGIIRFMRSDIEGAEKVWREALAVQRESRFIGMMPNTLANLGGARQSLGDIREAEMFYNEAIAVSRKTDDRYGELTGTINMAELLRLRGDLAASHAPYERGLRMARELTIPQTESYALAAMGELALWENKLPESRRLHEAALAMRKKAGERVSVAQSQVMLANLTLEEGKPPIAEALLREAVPVFAKEGAGEEEALAQETLARVLIAAGRTREAEACLTRANALTRKSRTLTVLSAVATAEARFFLADGRLSEASTRARQAIQHAERGLLLPASLGARLVAAEIDLRAGRAQAATAARAHVRAIATRQGLLLLAGKAR
jgi:tetratricopeptide (TPR) repeat protein/TolB-like protein